MQKYGELGINKEVDTIFRSLSEGFAAARMLFDENGQPEDYALLEINASFEKLSGIKHEDLGKKAGQFPQMERGWLQKFAQALLSGEPLRFEAGGETFCGFDVQAVPLGRDDMFAILILESQRGREDERAGELSYKCEKAEDALGKNERMLHMKQNLAFQANLLASANEAIYAADEIYKITYWNSAAEKLYGWTAKEAAGRFTYELFKHQIPGSTREEAVKQMLADDCWHGEAIHHHQNGTPIAIEAHTRVLRDGQGNFIGTITSSRDITDRKKTEEALAESEKLYHTIFDNSQDCFALYELLYDGSGRPVDNMLLKINKAFEEQSGIPAAFIVGKKASELVSGVEPEWLSFQEEVIKTGQPRRVEQYQQATGRWYDIYMFPYSGNMFGELFRDITERKKAEAILNENEQLYRTLFENTEEGFILLEPVFDKTGACADMKIVRINKAFELQAGIKKAERILNKRISRLSPDMEEKWRRYFGIMVQTGKSASFEEYNHLTQKWYDVHAFPFKQGQIGVLFRDISSRKQAEDDRKRLAKVLDEQLARLQALMETLPVGVWVADARGELVMANRAAAHLYGLESASIDRLRDYSLYKFWRPDTGKRIEVRDFPLMRSLKGESARDMVMDFERMDGTRGTQITSSVPVLDAQGGIMGSMAVMLDITTLKLAEEALRRSEEKYRNLFDSIDEGFCLIEKTAAWLGEPEDFRYVEVNYAFEVQSGVADVAGHAVSEVFPDESADWFGIFDEVLRTKKLIRYCTRLKATGRILETSAFHVKVQHADCVAVVFKDVTARKDAELELRRLKDDLDAEVGVLEKLHQINARFIRQEDIKSVYQGILDAAIELTRADCGNMQMAREDGTLEIIAHLNFGNAFVQYFHFVDTLNDAPTACAEAARENKRVIVPDVAHGAVLKGKALQVLMEEGIVCVQSTPMFSSSGNLLGMLSTHYKTPHLFTCRELKVLDMLARQAADVIERNITEEILEETKQHALDLVEELKTADRNKNEFINMMSHELRNPLASIVAGLSLLDITDEPAKTMEAKNIMRRQVGQLTRLVDDLLDLTRITHNKIGLKKERIELKQLALLVAEDSRPMFDEKGVALEIQTGGEAIILNADPVRLRQIIGNLLHNALKFTRVGGKTILCVYREHAKAFINVRDNGIGIEARFLPCLFEPFVQADLSLDRSNGGLGLGLSIAKGIAELHGGGVLARSEGPGRGSEFLIYLPIQEELKRTEGVQPKMNNGRTFTILVIEDNKDFADIVCTMLNIQGHRARAAHNGMEGLEAAREMLPRVIFCDIGLPGMSGYEVARRVREDARLKGIYLVALTGYAGPDDIDAAMGSGFDRHVAKPVDLASLKRILAEVP